MKHIAIAGAIIIVILAAFYFFMHERADAPSSTEDATTQNDQVFDTIHSEYQDQDTATGATECKLKVGNFTGKLEEVNTGCFVDGECYVVVDGKHVTVLRGWNSDTVGSVIGTADGIGGLEALIGQDVEVYAKDNGDGTYTLYGSEGFYVKAK